MVAVSVIICSHNPRPDYLIRVLEALRGQNLSQDQWELVLVDNSSRRELSAIWDLSWHKNARHVREEELGLTRARLKGIQVAIGDLLVFVDDDNVLASNYLSEALQIAHEWPLLGTWGGTITGEFEVPPEPWMQPLLWCLCIREFQKPAWSNNPEDGPSQPGGAGLCARASVARHYAGKVLKDPVRRKFGRIGEALSSCEDSDLVYTSCDLQMGFGNFPQLTLTHLIPKNRLQPTYLLSLMQGIIESGTVLRYLTLGKMPDLQDPFEVRARQLYMRLRKGAWEAQIYRANRDALRRGVKTALALKRERLKGTAVP